MTRRWTDQEVLSLEQPRVPGDAKGWTTGDLRVLEKDVQAAVLALLVKHPEVAFINRINSRVLDVVDKKSKKGTRPMRTAPKGHPDLCGMLKGGRALYVECKSSIGKLTDEQANFLSAANHFGGLAFVARSVADVLKYLPLR